MFNIKDFKEGDKVKIVSEQFDQGIGKVGIITAVVPHSSLVQVILGDNRALNMNATFPKDVIKKVSEKPIPKREKIIIFTVGNEVFAKLIYSDKSFTVASAKCNPADTFDILVGAQIALQRLTKKLNSKLVLPTEALKTVQVEVKINDTQNFEVV